jgi:hypothetical protein
LAELQKKCSKLERHNKEIAQYSEMISREIQHLRKTNELLINLNEKFGKENDKLREKINRLRKNRSSSDDYSFKRRKINKSKSKKKGRKQFVAVKMKENMTQNH